VFRLRPWVVVLYSQFLITALIIVVLTSISVIAIIILPCVVVLYSQFLITALIIGVSTTLAVIVIIILTVVFVCKVGLVPNVTGVSGFSILDCPFGFL
jgi:hypothetical protein